MARSTEADIRIGVRSGLAQKKPQKAPGKPSAKSTKSYSGGGANLPDIPAVKWETNWSGGIEGWRTPNGARGRKNRSYLGYLNQELLLKWGKLRPAERLRAVEDWIQQKRAEKGITLT
jgi:hypothetical protein